MLWLTRYGDGNSKHPRLDGPAVTIRPHAYQQEPAHCGMVDVSRRAGLPVAGSVVLTQSSMTDNGDSGVPEGLKLSVSGSVRGRCDSGIGTAVAEPSG